MKYRQRLMNFMIPIMTIALAAGPTSFGKTSPLHREVAPKPVYETLPDYLNTNQLIFKLKEGVGQPDFGGGKFLMTGTEWDRLNAVLSPDRKSSRVQRHFKIDVNTLNRMRQAGSQRIGRQLPDLSLYYEIEIESNATPQEKLDMIAEINSLDIIEIAYFEPIPELPKVLTPSWESQQNYLQPAPDGIDAYYAWGTPGGKGEGVKVVDVEGNWVESHEDLHGGTDHFHIAGSKIIDPGWWNHGTAVLGEIAGDSNTFGMTGIAFNVNLGTVSIGSMSTASAITTAAANCDTGDVILIELQTGGPNGGAYVPVEYYQASFDAIFQATATGRIVVEAGANGAQNLDDTVWYGHLFDPDYRFSGAIMVAAANSSHVPEWFTSYGQRLDVHAYGSNVYTLGYGDLYGSDTTNYYTSSFGGTSSASPIITGACAALQGINKAVHARVLDHTEMRALLQDYSTPQAPSYKHIGPMPDLQGSVYQIVGVSFYADTTIGWIPFDVNFTASSGLSVDTWTWDFGDGDSAFVQSPSHTYESSGMFTVKVEVDAGGDIRSVEKPNYIIALGDSLIAFDTAGAPGSAVVATIYARNTVPIRRFKIPVEFSGTLNLAFDSFSTEGCRTDYFEYQSYLHYDAGNKRVTIKLQSSFSGTSPDLDPGTGEILKLHFKIPQSAFEGQTASIELDGYNQYLPEFSGYSLDYEPIPLAATISLCLERGNLDGIPGVNVADVIYLVDYLFFSGPAPDPLEAGDVDCSGGINVVDLIYLVDYLFGGGPPP
ncbi:MAG: PKD domain-containing protein, partial [Candidatus Zixiibacteriota bacterium]